jgi:hypothetical protein
LIPTLLITIIIESAVVVGYSLWRKKPVRPILYTSLCINIITQSLLWIFLNLFFRRYLIALLVGEALIWAIESFLLFIVPANRLLFDGGYFLKPEHEFVEFRAWLVFADLSDLIRKVILVPHN